MKSLDDAIAKPANIAKVTATSDGVGVDAGKKSGAPLLAHLTLPAVRRALIAGLLRQAVIALMRATRFRCPICRTPIHSPQRE